MDEYRCDLAVKHGCLWLICRGIQLYFEYRHSSYIAWDRVHPNLIGATVIKKQFYPTAVLNTTISLQKETQTC